MSWYLRGWPSWFWFFLGFQSALILTKLAPHPLPWSWRFVLLPAAMMAVVLIPFLVYSLRNLFGFRTK